MNENQQQILCELLIGNGLLYNEAREMEGGILLDDEEFMNKMDNILKFCQRLYIDASEGNINKTLACHYILEMLVGIKKYRDSYSRYAIGYYVFNSVYDKTLESLSELIKSN